MYSAVIFSLLPLAFAAPSDERICTSKVLYEDIIRQIDPALKYDCLLEPYTQHPERFLGTTIGYFSIKLTQHPVQFFNRFREPWDDFNLYLDWLKTEGQIHPRRICCEEDKSRTPSKRFNCVYNTQN